MYMAYYSCTALWCMEYVDKHTPALNTLPHAQQVLKILDALDLPEYKEAFQKEHINGHVLLQLNHQILEDELGMDSKLHRIRLMTVVSGKVSGNTLLP